MKICFHCASRDEDLLLLAPCSYFRQPKLGMSLSVASFGDRQPRLARAFNQSTACLALSLGFGMANLNMGMGVCNSKSFVAF